MTQETATNGEESTVYRAAGRHVIHTERECVYLREAKRVVECDPESVDGRECRGCQGIEHRKDSQDHSLNSKLHELAQSDEDVILTDGGSDRQQDRVSHERVVETYPKRPDDPSLPAELELVDRGRGWEMRFRDVGFVVEVDGETYVADSIAPTDGYVKLAPGEPGGDMVGSSDHDVRVRVDLRSRLIATGGEYDGE